MALKKLLLTNKEMTNEVDGWQKKREDIISRLYNTIGRSPVFRNTRNIETISEEKLRDYTRRKIRYIVGDDDTIIAYILIPNNVKLPAPAVVAMHQYDSDKDEVVGVSGNRNYAYGHELAMRGYVVIAPDYLTSGERIYPDKESFDSAPFYEQYPGWSMVGKNIEDTKAAVDVLYTLDYVDKDNIGAIGHSHGGHNVIFGMALDNRIKVGVSNCGMSVFSREDKEYRLEWSLEEGYIYIPALRKYFLEDKETPFDIDEIAALIAPRPFMNISSYFDFAFGNQEFLAEVGVQLYKVYKLYGKENLFSYFMHGNNHSFPQYARILAYEWLDRFLKK